MRLTTRALVFLLISQVSTHSLAHSSLTYSQSGRISRRLTNEGNGDSPNPHLPALANGPEHSLAERGLTSMLLETFKDPNSTAVGKTCAHYLASNNGFGCGCLYLPRRHPRMGGPQPKPGPVCRSLSIARPFSTSLSMLPTEGPTSTTG